ncbi:helix-turn-helix transcriptional regulator [Nocardiopsis tropica]
MVRDQGIGCCRLQVYGSVVPLVFPSGDRADMEKKRGKAKWRKVGGELRALRTGANLRQKDVAPHAGVVPAQVSAWENGIRGMSAAQALALDRALNANGRLVRVYENAETPENLPKWYEQVPEIEQRVSELREYQCQLVPGLIQTDAYARAAISDALPWASDTEVKQMVTSRTGRRSLLAKDGSPLVTIVVEEFVLSRAIGDESIQAAQLDRVLELAERGKIRFQVVPTDVRNHYGTAGPFRIYTFPDRPALASAEYTAGEVLIDDLDTVQKCMTIFGFLQAEALPMAASVELVRKVRKGIDD